MQTFLVILQEDILNKLQNSVESEEVKWQQKLKSAEEEKKKLEDKVKQLEQATSSKSEVSLVKSRVKVNLQVCYSSHALEVAINTLS